MRIAYFISVHDIAKMAQNRATINSFLNSMIQFIVPFQHVSSDQRRVLIFLFDPLEIEKSRK